MHPRAALADSARILALLLAASLLSACLVTGITSRAYYESSGGADHDARVEAAWIGPGDDLVLSLADLEGVWEHTAHTLVLRPDELAQAFAAAPPPPGRTLPVPHVRLPRAVLARDSVQAVPAPDDPARVRAEPWEPEAAETAGERALVFPAPREGERFVVHWLHGYRAGTGAETGFALLVTRVDGERTRRALFLPEPFEPPGWIGLLAVTTVALDVLLIVLIVA